MRKALSFFVAVLISLTTISCMVKSYPTVPPPPSRIVMVKARPGYVWIPGHWVWHRGRYVWVQGHWAKARHGYVWVPGHWERQGNRWVWKKGRWVRR